MKRLGLSGRAVVLGALVLVPLAITLWLLTLAGRDLRNATDQRVRANQRGILVTQIGLRVVDIETSLRGFALTRDSRLLSPRDNAVYLIPQLERRLRLLLKGVDPGSVSTIRAYLASVDRYIDSYADPLLADLRAGVPGARDTARVLVGKRLVDGIRGQFSALVAREQAQSDASTASAKASADRSKVIGIIGLVSLPLLVILAALIVSRTLRRSRADLDMATLNMLDVSETNRAMLEASNDGFVAVDEAGVVIAYTDQAAKIFGHPAEEVMGHVLADIVLPPESREDHHERRRELLASRGRGAPYRVWVRRADGRSTLVEITAAPATSKRRRMGVYFVRDITDQRLREQERNAEEAVSRVLVQASGDDELVLPIIGAMGQALNCLYGTFWQYDAAERVVRCTGLWNDGDYAPPSVVTRLLAARFDPEDDPRPGDPIAMAWTTGREQWLSFTDSWVARTIPREDWREARAGFAIPVTVGGETIGVLGFATAEEEPPDAERWTALRSIVDLVGQVLARRTAEREAERLTHDFFALMSHELRTPLTSLIGYLDMVRDEEIGGLNDDQAQYLDVVDRSARRLMRLVGDLLFVAQIETGRLPLDLAPTDLRRVVLDAVESAQLTAGKAGVALATETEDVHIPRGDADRLAQLVDNLISNAIKFTPDGGLVTVRLRREGDEVVLDVQDTGSGISPEDAEHLFERFFRAEHAHRDAVAGLGLGLSICLAIVQAHDGTLTVTSAPGGGTLAQARFPSG